MTSRLPWKPNSLTVSPASLQKHFGYSQCPGTLSVFAPSRAGGACMGYTRPGSNKDRKQKAGHSMLWSYRTVVWTKLRQHGAGLGCFFCIQTSPPCRWHCSPRASEARSPASSCSGCAVPAAHALVPKGSSWFGWENPFSCIKMLQIGPIACQKLAVGDRANRCTKRQNYELHAGVLKSDTSTALSTYLFNLKKGVKGH